MAEGNSFFIIDAIDRPFVRWLTRRVNDFRRFLDEVAEPLKRRMCTSKGCGSCRLQIPPR
jgi:hypothetical protein